MKFPFVCNGCKHDFVCHKRKVKYSARKAEIYSQKHISESRKVIHRKKDEFDAFNEDLFKWVVLNSNTVHNYRVNHPQCIYSERQIYNLISELKLKVKPIDLKQSVKRKARKLYKKSVSIPKDYKNHRQYEDFLKYIEKNKDKIVVEIDTIHGKKAIKNVF